MVNHDLFFPIEIGLIGMIPECSANAFIFTDGKIGFVWEGNSTSHGSWFTLWQTFTVCYRKSPFWMGQSIISMGYFQ